MTTRLKAIDPDKATGRAKELLDLAQAKFGVTPNLMRTMANSPAVLKAYLDFSEELGTASLDPKLRERIALTVSETNRCEYCLSAHTAIGQMVGLSSADIEAARLGTATDPRIAAGLAFARELVARRGEVSDEGFNRIRRAGYSDGEVVEIIANVGLTIFTNYFNHVAQTEVDFPKVTPGVKDSERVSC